MRQLQNTLYITNDNIKTKVNRQAFEFMENDGTDIMHVPVHEIEKIILMKVCIPNVPSLEWGCIFSQQMAG